LGTSTTTETVYGCGGTPSFPQKTAFFFDFLVPAPAAAAAARFLEFNQNRKTVKLNEYSVNHRSEMQ
jgi:hypothetical protein